MLSRQLAPPSVIAGKDWVDSGEDETTLGVGRGVHCAEDSFLRTTATAGQQQDPGRPHYGEPIPTGLTTPSPSTATQCWMSWCVCLSVCLSLCFFVPLSLSLSPFTDGQECFDHDLTTHHVYCWLANCCNFHLQMNIHTSQVFVKAGWCMS